VTFFVGVAKLLTHYSIDPGRGEIAEIKSTYVRSLGWHIVLLGLMRRSRS
jgi:hypothetical protein